MVQTATEGCAGKPSMEEELPEVVLELWIQRLRQVHIFWCLTNTPVYVERQTANAGESHRSSPLWDTSCKSVQKQSSICAKD